ncbi:phosphoribosylamine--glycine ligase [bacterium]|nr:phosphoribosylamine--glycine ligase [bacterium]MBT6831780.1 phosphoribosylamine--glycine ligase [bacterium]MBT6995987.1 phosphoribosylamine--glycine ligase [bacterium]MBT7772642.1 phosphoribosylamine--glycine ligase [bacterium]
MKKIIVIGNGGREHAICDALLKSPQNPEIWNLATAVNPGIENLGVKIELTDSLENFETLKNLVEKIHADLVIPGPEAPLAAGVADFCREIGIPCFGPTRKNAQLESSKSWTRDLLKNNGIADACPDFLVSMEKDDPTRAKFFKKWNGQVVVKADGLLGGKGVLVAGDHFTDFETADDFAKKSIEKFGRVVLEEKLIGVEFSLISIVDGESVLDCRVCQDHKRVGENDVGPQTGGMGVISDENLSLPFLTKSDLEKAHNITVRAMHAVAKEAGDKFVGLLYGGFIATKNGVQLIEYNVRWGDPEALNILCTLESDFLEICESACAGNLEKIGKLKFTSVATVQKYLCAPGYPDDPEKGGTIELPAILDGENFRTFFAGVEKISEKNPSEAVKISGGRAIGIVGFGENLERANEICEQKIAEFSGNFHHRADIGTSKLTAQRVETMQKIRH